MALSQKHRSSVYHPLAPILGEAEVMTVGMGLAAGIGGLIGAG